LLIAFFLRIIVTPFGTHYLDQNTFIAWSNILGKVGFKDFYLSWCDYLPGYLYILNVLGKINLLKIIPSGVLFKLPAIISDVVTGYLIYKVSKRFSKESTALIIACFYLFNPAILGNSAMWGQVDSITSLFSISALMALPNIWISSLLLAISVLIKPQAAFIAPVIFLYFIKEKWRIEKIIYYILFSGSVFLLGFIPFYPGSGSFITFVVNRISVVLNQYGYGSVNAFNFWGFWGFWKPDDLGKITHQIIGFILVGALLSISYFLVRKKKGFVYLLSSCVYLVTYLFMTRMHERHMLPALAPIAMSLNFLPNLLSVYFIFSAIYVANLIYSYYWLVGNYLEVYPKPLIWLMISVQIFSLAYIFYEFYLKRKQIKIDKLWQDFKSLFKDLKNIKEKNVQKDNFPQMKIKPATRNAILIAVVLFSLVSRLAYLSKPTNEYFDEVYHAFTAREMLHGNKAAWEWWNTPPEGFAYEWTHPPLAKLFMWGSMKVFGENAFAWRLPGAILGTGIVYLIYLIAKKIFNDDILALISAAFFSLDGLALTMSRIGMNDSYLLFFSLLSIYFFLKEKDLFSALSFGLAISSKWSAMWVVPILFVIWFSRKDKFNLKLLWFLVVPLIYLSTYMPMFLTNHNLEIFWGMQKQMWWYHTRLKATHPYTSSWWTWPLDLRPVYFYTSEEINGMVSRIYNLGNPIVFWFGLVSVISSFFYSLMNKNRKLALVVFSYLVFFVPWAASPRIMFFYHYLPSVPFLAIATGYVLRKEKRLIIPVFVVTFLIYLYFYPHWAGLKIPLWYDSSYYIFSSWR